MSQSWGDQPCPGPTVPTGHHIPATPTIWTAHIETHITALYKWSPIDRKRKINDPFSAQNQNWLVRVKSGLFMIPLVDFQQLSSLCSQLGSFLSLYFCVSGVLDSLSQVLRQRGLVLESLDYPNQTFPGGGQEGGGGGGNQGQEGETADLWPVATLTTGDNRKASDSLEIIPLTGTNNTVWAVVCTSGWSAYNVHCCVMTNV